MTSTPRGEAKISVPQAFAKGFVWGAAIGAFVRYVGLTRWLIIFAVLIISGYFVNLSQKYGAEEARTAGARVEIVGFNTSDQYHQTLVVRVVNPSDKTLESFSAKCFNIEFNGEQSILPGHEGLVEADFFIDRFNMVINPRTSSTPIACEFSDSDFD